MRAKNATLAAAAIVLCGTTAPFASEVIDFDTIASRIVDDAAAVEPGEIVVVVGSSREKKEMCFFRSDQTLAMVDAVRDGVLAGERCPRL